MRLARPLLLFALLCGFSAASQTTIQSQSPPGGGVNALQWGKGSPSATVGGVNVSVTQVPTTNWTCTELVVRVIEDSTSKTLAETTFAYPQKTTLKSYTDLGSGVKLRVTADATFQNGSDFDFKYIEAYVTTQ